MNFDWYIWSGWMLLSQEAFESDLGNFSFVRGRALIVLTLVSAHLVTRPKISDLHESPSYWWGDDTKMLIKTFALLNTWATVRVKTVVRKSVSIIVHHMLHCNWFSSLTLSYFLLSEKFPLCNLKLHVFTQRRVQGQMLLGLYAKGFSWWTVRNSTTVVSILCKRRVLSHTVVKQTKQTNKK